MNDEAHAPMPLSALLAEVVASLAERRDAVHEVLDDAHDDELPAAARELIAAVLDRSWSALRLAERDRTPLSRTDVARVRSAVARARTGMPLAYAVGSAAFRHLVLQVDERVLIPRSETELLIDHALRLTRESAGGIAVDVGTGSGAIALALAQEGAFTRVIGTDISADALDVARSNGDRWASVLRAAVEWRLGADLTPVQGLSVRLLVSNPPYIAFTEAALLPSSVRDWEPPTALFADNNGLARYEALLHGAPALLEPGGWVVLECDSRRAHETAAIAHAVGAYDQIEVYDDLTGRPRILVARRHDRSPPGAI